MMAASATIASPAWMNALKDHCIEYVENLYSDAGVTEGMPTAEVNARISAEHSRRARAAVKRKAEAELWQALFRRRED